MKALTIRQPWCWATTHTSPFGPKDIENRARSLGSHTGPIAIHAGANWSDAGAADPRVRAAFVMFRSQGTGDTDLDLSQYRHWFPAGAVVAVAHLTGTHAAAEGCCDSPWADREYDGEPIRAHLCLADARPLPEPIPCRGALGLWTLPAHVEAAVVAALAPAGAP